MEEIKPMLTHFSDTYGKAIRDPEAYFQVLRLYTKKEIYDAGFKCLGQLKRLPMPADIVERIPRQYSIDEELPVQECEQCGELKPCYKGKCQRCYTGLTGAQVALRFKQIRDKIGAKNMNQEIDKKKEKEQLKKLQDQKAVLEDWG